MHDENKVTYFGETDFRNKRTRFGIKAKDRSKHIYIIGKTGMGKSTLLENLAIQDIQNDEGMIFIDPHGSTAVKLLEYVPRHRIDDVVYFAPHDTDFPIAFNVLEQVPKEKRNAVAGGLMSAFKKIWVDSFSSRMEYLLNYTLLALLDVPGSTLLGINRLLSDKVYRRYIVERVEDSLVKSFWTTEFERYSTTYATEAVAPIQNKVGQFIASPMIRNIVGQEVSTIDFRTFMDQKKIVIINISKGIIGPENMRLLGGMLITKIQLAAMSRANLNDESLRRIPNTYLYVDEFQNFANESFAEILSESRKYKLCLTVANQYMDQMTEEVRNAVIGNVGTFISFRVGSTDAEIMEKEFAPNFTSEDMVNLGFTQMYLKLMIDGIGSRPFSANSLPPIPKPSQSYVEEIIGHSRKYFAGEKSNVEEDVKKWTNRDYNLELQRLKQASEPKPQPKKEQPKVEVKEEAPKEEVKKVEQPQQQKQNNNNGSNNGNGKKKHKDKVVELVKKIEEEEDDEDFDKELEEALKALEEKKQTQSQPAKKNSVSAIRRRTLTNLQRMYALQSNFSKQKTDAQKKDEDELDEIPEDVLKALLDNTGL
jgi:energy-coupling factor transporter ATP-binding protein EcfA2